MKVDTDDLVTILGIARRLGVSAPAVSNWRIRHDDFPAPVFDEDRSVLFLWWQVEAWAAHHGKVTK